MNDSDRSFRVKFNTSNNSYSNIKFHSSDNLYSKPEFNSSVNTFVPKADVTPVEQDIYYDDVIYYDGGNVEGYGDDR